MANTLTNIMDKILARGLMVLREAAVMPRLVNIDYANEAKERLTCSYEGEDIEIGFNSRFMQEMLTNLHTEEIKVEMSAPNRAGLIIPVDNENKDEDILMLVMPVMLNT